MMGATEFTALEKTMIARMYKERMPARQIAKILDKPPVDVSNYIKTILVKRQKPPTIIGDTSVVVTQKLKHIRVGGLRHYTDPLAAREGSRKLLEAINGYLKKREGIAA